MSKLEDEKFFKLLVNISASSESSLERLSTSLRVFVKKYFDNNDFTEPSEPVDIALECIMKSEAILYTVYELEPEAITEEAKLELLYYKDLVMKTLVVLTNLDFFVSVLKENGLFKDAYNLREKVKLEFRLEAASLKQNIESGDFLSQGNNQKRLFKDITPTEYRRLKPEKKELSKSDIPENSISVSENRTLNPLEELKKKIRQKSKESEPKTDKNGNKVLRTAMGWEIPEDFFNSGLYS